MAVHIIRVFRDLSDVGSRREPEKSSFFYKDIDHLCTGVWEPNTDIFETKDNVFIRVELAGIAQKDITVKVKNGKLMITGVRKSVKSKDQMYFHQMEIHCGKFNKVIALPLSLEHNDIQAELQEGLLEIRISKKGQPIEIPISVDSHTNS